MASTCAGQRSAVNYREQPTAVLLRLVGNAVHGSTGSFGFHHTNRFVFDKEQVIGIAALRGNSSAATPGRRPGLVCYENSKARNRWHDGRIRLGYKAAYSRLGLPSLHNTYDKGIVLLRPCVKLCGVE